VLVNGNVPLGTNQKPKREWSMRKFPVVVGALLVVGTACQKENRPDAAAGTGPGPQSQVTDVSGTAEHLSEVSISVSGMA
jgi:hypothetical protein